MPEGVNCGVLISLADDRHEPHLLFGGLDYHEYVFK